MLKVSAPDGDDPASRISLTGFYWVLEDELTAAETAGCVECTSRTAMVFEFQFTRNFRHNSSSDEEKKVAEGFVWSLEKGYKAWHDLQLINILLCITGALFVL